MLEIWLVPETGPAVEHILTERPVPESRLAHGFTSGPWGPAALCGLESSYWRTVAGAARCPNCQQALNHEALA